MFFALNFAQKHNAVANGVLELVYISSLRPLLG